MCLRNEIQACNNTCARLNVRYNSGAGNAKQPISAISTNDTRRWVEFVETGDVVNGAEFVLEKASPGCVSAVKEEGSLDELCAEFVTPVSERFKQLRMVLRPSVFVPGLDNILQASLHQFSNDRNNGSDTHHAAHFSVHSIGERSCALPGFEFVVDGPLDTLVDLPKTYSPSNATQRLFDRTSLNCQFHHV